MLVLTVACSFHTKERRGFSVVQSTQKYDGFPSLVVLSNVFFSRLFWYAIFESCGVIAMAAYVFFCR